MKRPTGSRLGLAMECIGSVLLPGISSSSPEAEAGTARHAFLAALHAGKAREEALEAVPEEHRETCDAMDDSMLPALAGLRSEVAMAYNPAADEARPLHPKSARDYSGASPGDYRMTLDYCGSPDGRGPCVYDLKTGMVDSGRAVDSWQLRLGALALTAADRVGGAWPDSPVKVALIKAREGMRTKWSTGVLELMDLDRDRALLVDLSARLDAAEATGVKTSDLSVGAHCRHCPARMSCPAQTAMIRSVIDSKGAELTDLAARVATMTTAELSEAWQKAQPFLDAAKALKTAFAEAAKVQPFETDPGMQYGLRDVTRTEIDGAVAFDVLNRALGLDAARAGVTFEASKASVARGVKRAKETGSLPPQYSSAAAATKGVLDLISEAGGTRKSSASRLEEHAIPERIG